MTSRQLIILATFIGCAVLLAPWPPLGVQGEWVWPRQALPLSIFETLDRLVWPMLCGAAIVTCFAESMRRIETAGTVLRGLLLLGLTGLSFLWLNAVRQAAPSPQRELRPTWILYDKYASGYFYNATFNVSSTKQMLIDYEARMAEGDVLHEGTHPPGLLLFNRSLLKLTEEFPAVVELSESLQNAESVRMFREVETAGQLARPLSKSELAALHLSSLLSTLFVAMTVIPVFGLARRLTNSRVAWRAAAFMITVPTIGVFVPRSDVLYACSGMLLAWAAENPEKVGAFAGIYPVVNLTSYPGLDQAAPAYALTAAELAAQLTAHNPVDRLATLAAARIPLFAIHGDRDTLVPLDANSALLKSRYTALGGDMKLIIAEGQGHNLWPGFFENPALLAFLIAHARP